MTFDSPAFLWLLLACVLLLPVFLVLYRKNRGKAVLFAAAAPSHERESTLREMRLRMIFSDICFLLFLAFLVLAMAGPRWGLRIVTDHRRGVDIILAFDLSRSMGVEDCEAPEGGGGRVSRLERAGGIARELAAVLGDIRLGTVIGKGRGVVAVPLTYDSESVFAFLQSLDSGIVSGAGTNLESLVEAAIGAFGSSLSSRRALILFSDGESLSGSFQDAAENARKAGIILSAVGLGTESGGYVPVEPAADAPGGFLLGLDGSPVVSSRREEFLKNGAEKTGGVYIDGSRNDAARFLSGYISSFSAETRLHSHRQEASPRWRIFVLASMTCLAFARIMGFSLRKGKQGGKAARVLPGLLCFLCLFLFGSCTQTRGQLLIMEANFFYTRGFYTEAISSYLRALEYEDAVPYAEYGLASAFFALEEGSAALERYREAERLLIERGGDHRELHYRIHYNMGIIHFEKGEYEEAVSSFREALKIDGSRVEAKRNLELSLLTDDRNKQPEALSSQENAENPGQGQVGASFVLFEYLKQKEQEQWKSREWAGESESSTPDY